DDFSGPNSSRAPAIIGQQLDDARDYFARARVAADESTLKRWAYMEDKFSTGQHPDTDPNFWQGWTDTPSPPLPNSRPFSDRLRSGEPLAILTVLAIPVAAIIGMIWAMRRLTRRSAAQPLNPVTTSTPIP
ncbi:MAG: hypothetical protein K2X32_02905, partial [Phycisphaerales bacterium]|nr:hypothetical protein [Phycisphaerales bacterium]